MSIWHPRNPHCEEVCILGTLPATVDLAIGNDKLAR
jgi:hypothetical protein